MSICEVKEVDGIKGLYASVSFKKGDVLFQLQDKIFPTPSPTSIKVGEDRHSEDPFGRFINHGCEPSVKVDGYNIIALRDIVNGDEIAFNYLDNEDKLVNPFYCKCCGKRIE